MNQGFSLAASSVAQKWWPAALAPAALLSLLADPPGGRPAYVVGLSIAGALAVLFLATPAVSEHASRCASAHSRLLVSATIAAYFVVCYSGALVAYASFGMLYGHDFYAMDQSYWNTLQGRLFWVGFGGMGSLWAYHFSPVLLLFLPSYALFPGPTILLFWQTLFLSLSAVPLWMILRRRLTPLPSILLTWAYLLLPGIFAQHFNNFDEASFAALPFLLAVFFYQERRWRAFITTYALGSLTVEWVSLALSGFALLAFVQRRSARWIATPVALSVTWYAISTGFVMPYFRAAVPNNPPADWNLSKYQLLIERASNVRDLLGGDSLADLVGLATPSRGIYVLELFSPLLFLLPLAAPEVTLAIPEILKNVAADSDGIRSLSYPHSIIASAALMVAAGMGLNRVSARFSWSSHACTACSGLILVLCLTAPTTVGSALTLVYSWRVPHDALRGAAMQVPAGASVAAPSRALSHLTRQWEIYYTDAPGTAELVHNRVPEWVIHSEAQPDWRVPAWMGVDEHALREDLRGALRSPAYAVQWEQDGVRVYRLALQGE